jgi:lipid-A-disaccharide synthase
LFVRKSLVQYFTANPPDIFIGVDAPDFNLGLEQQLKDKGIKTVHYVSPTVWAWREKRIFKIARATHLVLSIFPFEKQVYDKHHIPCEFVGHTLADQIPIEPNQDDARETLKIRSTGKVLALLPGSRASEVAMLLDIFMQSCQLLAGSLPGLKILIPVVNRHRKEQIERYLQEHPSTLDVQIVIGHSREVMIAADAVLLASGTAALEAMLCKRPMVVAYRLKPVTYQMMKWLYKAKYFALPNVLAGEALVTELLQGEVNPQNICEELLPILTADSTEQQALVQRFTELHHSLKKDADEQAAHAVSKLLEGK